MFPITHLFLLFLILRKIKTLSAFRCVPIVAKSAGYVRLSPQSVRPYVPERLPLGRFSLNLILGLRHIQIRLKSGTKSLLEVFIRFHCFRTYCFFVLCLFLYLFVYSFVRSFVSLFVYLFVCSFVWLFVFLALQLIVVVPILSQLDPVHTPTSHILKIHLNVILPSTPGSPKLPRSFRYPQRKFFIRFSSPTYALRAQPITFFSIISPEQYWVSSTDH
jgi:hypothetical protein